MEDQKHVVHACVKLPVGLVWVHSSRWLGRTGSWLKLTTCEGVIHDFKSLVGFEQRPGNLAWTRKIGTGKKGSKLYVHGRGKGRATAGDVPGRANLIAGMVRTHHCKAKAKASRPVDLAEDGLLGSQKGPWWAAAAWLSLEARFGLRFGLED